MVVRLNGELRDVPEGTTAASLLQLLGLRPARVAVLVNDAVVIRDLHADRGLAPGDRVEIVPLMGGD